MRFPVGLRCGVSLCPGDEIVWRVLCVLGGDRLRSPHPEDLDQREPAEEMGDASSVIDVRILR